MNDTQIIREPYRRFSWSSTTFPCALTPKSLSLSDSPLMVRPKHTHNRSAPGKKHQNQGSPKVDPPDEGDWIFVKKQRVTIIIPPLPNKIHSAMPSVGEDQLQEKLGNGNSSQSPKKTNSQLQCSPVISASKQLDQEAEKSMQSPELAVQPPIGVHPSEPNLNIEKPSSLSHRAASKNSPLHSHREGNGIGVCSTSKSSKRMKIYADSSAFINQRMRASYLEKKLKKAGGLENWLVSLGLTRFVKVFQMRSVNKFQLANLTMQKLKDMGTDAVGPRRKLMHAIDCLCEPHCFQRV